jgi:hypothetical protein
VSGDLLPQSSEYVLKMRTAGPFVTLVTVYNITQHHDPEEHSLNFTCLFISYVINVVCRSFWESGMWCRKRQQAASA